MNIYGFKSLEPNEALFDKRREELMAWRSTHEEFDESELGRSGIDQLPLGDPRDGEKRGWMFYFFSNLRCNYV